MNTSPYPDSNSYRNSRILEAKLKSSKGIRNLQNRLDKRHSNGKGAKVTILTTSGLLSEELEFSCTRHGIWKSVGHRVRDNMSFTCPECASEAVSNRLKAASALKNYEQVLEASKQLGFKILNEDSAPDKPFKAVCLKHGNKFTLPKVSNSTYPIHRRCPDCSKEKVAARGQVRRAKRLANLSLPEIIAAVSAKVDNLKIEINPEFIEDRARPKFLVVCTCCGEDLTSSGWYHNLLGKKNHQPLTGIYCPVCNHSGPQTKPNYLRRMRDLYPSFLFKIPELRSTDRVPYGTEVYAKCKIHGEVFKFKTGSLSGGLFSMCPSCKQERMTLPERKVKSYLDKLGMQVVTHDRTQIRPKELDLWLPDKKVAIEVDGVYWHSRENSARSHKLKRDLCLEKGIRLLSFTDQQISSKWSLVKSMIRQRLGVDSNLRKLNARSLELGEVTIPQARKFADENHISGFLPASHHLGLFLDGELVSYLSAGKPRFNRKESLEIYRFCSARNTLVRGGFSRLLAELTRRVKTAQTILSYSDCRTSTGGVYESIGFELQGFTRPSYVWSNGERVLKRYDTQKHKLQTLLPNFDPEATEEENMKANGYTQTFDYGNSVWVLSLNQN